jgi:CysZ protein
MTNHVLPPSGVDAPRARPGILGGIRALFSGLGFIVTTPATWPLALAPAILWMGLSAVLWSLVVKLLPPLFMGWLAGTGGAASKLLTALATGLAMVLALFVGLAMAQPLAAPALERIVRRVEIAQGTTTFSETSLFEGLRRSLGSVLVSFSFGAPLLALLFLVTFAFPPAAVITVPLKLAVVALLAAWDFCDFPLSLRGLSVGARVALVRRNLPAMLGFGLGVALLSLVPCALLFVLPVGMAGAARLVGAIERIERVSSAASAARRARRA